jgi:hypothetical protein
MCEYDGADIVRTLYTNGRKNKKQWKRQMLFFVHCKNQKIVWMQKKKNRKKKQETVIAFLVKAKHSMSLSTNGSCGWAIGID